MSNICGVMSGVTIKSRERGRKKFPLLGGGVVQKMWVKGRDVQGFLEWKCTNWLSMNELEIIRKKNKRESFFLIRLAKKGN